LSSYFFNLFYFCGIFALPPRRQAPVGFPPWGIARAQWLQTADRFPRPYKIREKAAEHAQSTKHKNIHVIGIPKHKTGLRKQIHGRGYDTGIKQDPRNVPKLKTL